MKLTSSEYKEIARDALRGNRPKATVAFVLAMLFGAFCTSFYFMCQFATVMGMSIRFFEQIPHFLSLLLVTGILLALFFFFVGGVIRFGYIDFNLALLDRRKVKISRVFGKFSLFWKAIYMKIIVGICEFFYTLLLIVPGIMAFYGYAMVPYILEEKPNYSVGRAMRVSKKIMKGHKWQLFCLRFSFIGWYVLGILTLGIAFLYVGPYINAAEAVFYNEISGRADAFYGREKKK